MTITINSYPQHDSGNDREKGVTADINKVNKCDGDEEKTSKRDSGNDESGSGDESYIGRDSGLDKK